MISEYIWVTSAQLKKIIELHDEMAYKKEIYIAGMGRITDFEDYDFIKTMIKPQEEALIKDIYKRVGLLNLFNPFHPDGTYAFDLKIYEERMMLNILCELAKREGIKNMGNILQDKKAVDSADTFVKAPPKEGEISLPE